MCRCNSSCNDKKYENELAELKHNIKNTLRAMMIIIEDSKQLNINDVKQHIDNTLVLIDKKVQ